MSKLKKIIALVTALMLALALSGCSGKEVGMEINIAVLSGPTGIGAVYLMEANDAGETTNSYNFTVSSANDDVVAGLTSGEYDIAAVATNVAANLYNKTDGAIQICALNTYGVLYILENGDGIQSVEDLRGKTIYATGQGANPEYVLDYILTQNGIDPDNDVTIEFMDSDALVTLMATGEAEICMLPVPAVTSVMIQNSDLRIALDMTEEWNNVTDEGELTMGCVVVRTEFAEENPEAVEAFLEEYAASIENVQENIEHAAELCETYGIVAKAAVAQKAIPDCNLCCITGDEIKSTIEPYYTVLYNANASSIGGAIPDEDFYFAK
ncbi:MAG: ABC transporter substrate-binding protein [Oscillospiraceae bacterium]|nr:ABC transporter substrate-binding protein [Oscillospiraceae bacterium]